MIERYQYRQMAEERSEPRIAVSIQGRYRMGSGVARDVIVSDISTMGCKFYDRFSSLKKDSRITIRIGNIGPLDALVRWQAGQLIGVRFDDALHPSVFDHMVTTISDWSVPKLNMPPIDEPPEPPKPALDVISICIRQPTRVDFRLAITELQLSLPLATEAELEAVFHQVLNAIFVRESDD